MSAIATWASRALKAHWIGEPCCNPKCVRRVSSIRLPGGSPKRWFLDGSAYCSIRCLQEGLHRWFVRSGRPMLRTPYRHRVPLGLTLLSKGQVSKANLESALTLQHEHGGRLGKCLQEVYGIPEAVITAAVAEQWNMPAFHGDAPSSVPAELLPASLVRELDILPVHWNPASRTLLLGFPQAVEFALMAAIERVLGCRVEACIVGDSLFRAGACACDASVGSTIRFAAHTTASETVEIILNYLERTGCRDLRAAHAPDFYWARLAGAPIDLLFDLPHA